MLNCSTVAQLEEIQKQFIWKNGNSKYKHTTLCSEYEQGGLKNVDIFCKITILHCSWVKRLHGDSFHSSKVTPLFLIENHQGKNFVFHSNLNIKQKVIKKFPKFYQEILTRWGKYLCSPQNFNQLLPLNLFGIVNT